MKNFETSSDKSDKGRGYLFIFVLMVLFLISGRIFSQGSEWKLKSVALTTGKTPLSSGLNLDAFLSNGKNTFFLSYNTVLGQVMYEIPLTKWCSVSPTGGIYHNLPWAGPLLTFKAFKGHLITNHWFGWSAGIPEEGGASLKKTIFIFSFQEMKYTFNKTSLDYVLMHYEDDSPIHMMGIARRFPICESSEITGSFTYVHPTEEIMWSLGFIYNFC